MSEKIPQTSPTSEGLLWTPEAKEFEEKRGAQTRGDFYGNWKRDIFHIDLKTAVDPLIQNISFDDGEENTYKLGLKKAWTYYSPSAQVKILEAVRTSGYVPKKRDRDDFLRCIEEKIAEIKATYSL
jgi:hypothetical protein